MAEYYYIIEDSKFALIDAFYMPAFLGEAKEENAKASSVLIVYFQPIMIAL
jgi:hypothetical protein